MIITYISKEGGRTVNEDAFNSSRKRGISCVVVADGLGGHNGGRLASELAVNTIIETFNRNTGFSKEHISEYINTARSEIVNKAMTDPDLLHMSSTIAMLLIKGRNVIWANVGDSRVYRFYEGDICEVSEDHSLAFIDFVKGDIEYGEIRTSPNQNKLTSALGVATDGMNISEKTPINGSTVFLLCTDGFWTYVTEEEMEATYKTAKDPREWLTAMIEIRERKAPHDSDNFTAAVVAV